MYTGPNIIKDNLVFGYDTGYGVADNNTATRLYPGKPTTNHVTNPETMAGWTSYSNGNDGTFITEFGTTGYKIINRASWNGLYKAVNVPSTGTYTFSAWFRYLGGTANNNGATVYVGGYGASDTATWIDKSKVGEWQRISKTVNFTDTDLNAYFYLISYGGSTGSDTSSWEVTMPQVEAGSVMTPFTSGTRSSTASLIDLKGTADIDVSNVSFNSTGQPDFDGTSDYINITNYTQHQSTSGTIEAVVKLHTISGNRYVFGAGGTYTYGATRALRVYNGYWGIVTYGSGNEDWGPGVAASTTDWQHVAFGWNGTTVYFYINGVRTSTTRSGLVTPLGSVLRAGMPPWGIGSASDGEIPILKHYSHVLTETEIKQNFNAYKNRFGI